MITLLLLLLGAMPVCSQSQPSIAGVELQKLQAALRAADCRSPLCRSITDLSTSGPGFVSNTFFDADALGRPTTFALERQLAFGSIGTELLALSQLSVLFVVSTNVSADLDTLLQPGALPKLVWQARARAHDVHSRFTGSAGDLCDGRHASVGHCRSHQCVGAHQSARR
jgi:hypothetical protein